ncbi:type II toxin-antitoxin system VapC family toxin [Rhizobium sp. LCM 4573]|uniref:type II toxin-antitoxin system VapC family toxin n=1 Tax=Rhizobium sp. LCM 4573 TaxID=1848291 RepID=UPI0012FF6456|nr:type II toxin-antitoxin system VapC family toxin [Rhizobium sp. LCM 4573]
MKMSNSPSVVLVNRRVVINDACCLIDLHKVGLIQPMLGLPFNFHVALPVRANELLSISAMEWASYERAGMQTIDLPGDQVATALSLREAHPTLSAEDCFSLVLARETRNGLLLTGDAALREVAEHTFGLEVHGVLWVADLIVEHGVLSKEHVCRCLEEWQEDPLVRLPHRQIAARITNWRKR